MLQRDMQRHFVCMRIFFKFIYKYSCLFLDFYVCLGFSRGGKEGVVLIRLDAIGDFIIWLDSAKEFRQIYPNEKITLIANSAWSDLASSAPYWDEVWSINITKLTQNPIYRWRILRKIRRKNFKIAIQPTFSRAIMYGDSIIRATRSENRIGSMGDMFNISLNDKNISDRWYTKLLPASAEPMMELMRNTEFMRNLSKKNISCALQKWSSSESLRDGLQVRDGYAILFPGASWVGRRWPREKFSEIARWIHAEYGWKIVLCGAHTDFELCEEITRMCGVPCLNFAGHTTLIELFELIRNSNLLISNETSAIHMAVAVNTPSICILGGGHFGRFAPYPDDLVGLKPLIALSKMTCFGCNWACNQDHEKNNSVPCIYDISVEQVIKLVSQSSDLIH